jgi:carbon storage regulator
MLVLNRRLNERIVIDGGRIVITVVEILGCKVRIGFEAAQDVIIDREEIYWDKQRERRN